MNQKMLVIDVLRSLNKPSTRHESIEEILGHIKTHLGVSATAIRVRDGEDYPYYTFTGFSDTHIEMESQLCVFKEGGDIMRDLDGTPVLACLCGQVINGTIPRDSLCSTENGSFWVNDITKLNGETRNVCNVQGYKSIAFIPLKKGKETIGLLQINDKKLGKFTESIISVLEHVGDGISLALAYLMEEEKRRELEQTQKELRYQYRLRINQLNCLYKISKLKENKDISLEELLNLIVSLIPEAMQHPDTAVAKLRVEKEMYLSENYQEPRDRYDTIVESYGLNLGKLMVGYVERTARDPEDVFLEEEIKLINLIAESISRLIEQDMAGNWNKSIDRYALILNDEEMSQIMKLVVEDTAINEMDREEFNIGDIPMDTNQTLDSYMQLQQALEVNRTLLIKLQNLLK